MRTRGPRRDEKRAWKHGNAPRWGPPNVVRLRCRQGAAALPDDRTRPKVRPEVRPKIRSTALRHAIPTCEIDTGDPDGRPGGTAGGRTAPPREPGLPVERPRRALSTHHGGAGRRVERARLLPAGRRLLGRRALRADRRTRRARRQGDELPEDPARREVADRRERQHHLHDPRGVGVESGQGLLRRSRLPGSRSRPDRARREALLGSGRVQEGREASRVSLAPGQRVHLRRTAAVSHLLGGPDRRDRRERLPLGGTRSPSARDPGALDR